jgi:hypothetical protein
VIIHRLIVINADYSVSYAPPQRLTRENARLHHMDQETANEHPETRLGRLASGTMDVSKLSE